MNTVNKFFIPLLSCSLFFAACEQKTKQADPTVLAEVDNNSPSAATEKPEAGATTSIEFSEKQHDFGLIHKGEMVTHVFTFKNSGSSPLIIMDAKASCGCTVPQWTKEPVAPGETGEIEVKYNGSGSGQVHKTVTVVANTEPKETVLEIKANVKDIDTNLKGPYKK